MEYLIRIYSVKNIVPDNSRFVWVYDALYHNWYRAHYDHGNKVWYEGNRKVTYVDHLYWLDMPTRNADWCIIS